MEHSQEDLERIKLSEEIRNLKRPFFLRPQFLSIVLSSLFAAITIYFSIAATNKNELDELKAKNITLDNKINSFDRRQLVLEKAALEKSIKALKIKETNLRDSLFIQYNKDLIEMENSLEEIANYYVEDYSIGYANSYVKSIQVNQAINEFVVNGKDSKFKEWLYGSTKRAIDKSNKRSMDKVLNEIGLKLKLNQYKK
jgi:hypothetical protein